MTEADNFPSIQVGGKYIDYDALRNNAYIGISYGHDKIHEGEMYTASYRWDSLANGGTAWFTGVIPADMFPHTEFEISVGGNCTFDIIEGGTLDGGTTVTAMNRNRNAATLSIASMAYHSGTVNGGSVIYQTYLPGGSKNFAVGAGARANSEWIHKEGVTTAWKVVNTSGGAVSVSMEATFYDEEE